MATKTYFVRPEKKLVKQGYVMEDENQEIVYSADFIKKPLIGAALVEFNNRLTGKKAEHKVGHTVTVEDEAMPGGGLLDGLMSTMSKKSYFKFDGVKIWDHLHEKGIRIDSSVSGKALGMDYKVSLKGQEIATIVPAAGNGGRVPIATGVTFKVTTDDENIDMAFLVAFSIARTEQTFYN